MRNRDAENLAYLAATRDGIYSEESNEALLEAVPHEMQLIHFTREAVPERFRPSFAWYHDKIGNLHLDGLPTQMQREMIYAIWRIIDSGGRIPVAHLSLFVRELGRTETRLGHRAAPHSLMRLTPDEWSAALASTWARRTGELPKQSTQRSMLSPLPRVWKFLWYHYDARPWWEREIWDLQMDPRIPRREHEIQKFSALHWYRITTPWLRFGAMYWFRRRLESEGSAWSSALGDRISIGHFDRFVQANALRTPEMLEDHSQIRPLMLRYLSELRSEPKATTTRGAGQRNRATVSGHAATIRGLFAYAHDNREDIAASTGNPEWMKLGPEHLRFWRPGDFPSHRARRATEAHIFDDDSLSKISAVAHKLGEPRESGGYDEPQAMRILLLMIATGRRVNEICMLDPYPILPIAGGDDSDGKVAKLKYQQTKIEGAPDTIFVDQEVIGIIAEQQAWLAQRRADNGVTEPPKYLFVRHQGNLYGRNPYQSNQLRNIAKKMAERDGVTDRNGQPIQIGATHRFRHTKATSLINAGVPLHVVQRYLGHLSPEMTMHYAQTLDSTAKAEFLRYQKLMHTGETAPVSSNDLYDLMALDNRTDRVLPNGWCTLPPAKSCDKGNACLTCNMFVTDERFLGTHEGELVALDNLIDSRQRSHTERTGSPMSENHVWLELRRREQKSLGAIIKTIKKAQGDGLPIRGPGVQSRQDTDRNDQAASR